MNHRTGRLHLIYLAWMLILLLWGLLAPRAVPLPIDALVQRVMFPVGLVLGLVLSAWAMGLAVQQRWLPLPKAHTWEAATYALLLGLGMWSLLAAWLAWIGLARTGVLRFLSLVLGMGSGWYLYTRRPLLPLPHLPRWFFGAASLLLALALLPPSSMDALMYHLAMPWWLLQKGGYRPFPVAHFWFPGHMEHLYLWFLAWGNDRAARLLHAGHALAACLWVYMWTRQTLGPRSARYALMVLLAMPALYHVATWAYTDAGLALYTIAALYALDRFLQTRERVWLPYLGWNIGLALGVKYTAFVLPLAVGLSLGLAARKRYFPLSWSLLKPVVLWATVPALPWYARNAWFMHNPVYPFGFGGKDWDAFLARWYAQPGSGLLRAGLAAWLRFPLEIMTGLREGPEGNIGPWWFILAVPALFWFWKTRQRAGLRLHLATGPYLFLGLAFWMAGALWSAGLQQARLLWPVLFPLSIWMGLGLHGLRCLHGPQRPRYRALTALLSGLYLSAVLGSAAARFVFQDGPAWLLGGLTVQAFYQRHNPAYAELLQVLETLPPEARVYALYEPRSYGAPCLLIPDTLLAHWAHDLYRYRTPAAVLQAWKEQYTHVLLFTVAERFLFEEARDPAHFPPEHQAMLHALLDGLPVAARSPSGAYVLYSLHPAAP